MNKILTTISVAVVFFLSLVNANAGSLTVYTAIEAEDLKRYADTFNEDHPDTVSYTHLTLPTNREV